MISHMHHDTAWSVRYVLLQCFVCLQFVISFAVGQEKIVRAFAEIMKNMSRMKTCVRPAMCKPYGKQSEALQKSK